MQAILEMQQPTIRRSQADILAAPIVDTPLFNPLANSNYLRSSGCALAFLRILSTGAVAICLVPKIKVKSANG